MWLLDLSLDFDSHFFEELIHALGHEVSFSYFQEILMHFTSYQTLPNSTSFSICLILSHFISSSLVCISFSVRVSLSRNA